MTEIDRRRFLQLAGGTAVLSALSPSIARAKEIPANRANGSIEDVEHIVVLMQENRSFDHFLGSLRGVRGFGDPRPYVMANGKSVWHQSDGTREVLPFHPGANDLGLKFLEGTPHDWNSGHVAWNNGRYDKWLPAKGTMTMAYYDRDDAPFHYALADAFTICDAYHCSMMGPTDPNRYYMLTGYTGNDGKGGGPDIENGELGYSWMTYAERLEAAGISWKVYQDEGTGIDGEGDDGWGWTDDPYIGNYGDNSLLYFDNFRNAKPGDPLYEKARTGTRVLDDKSFEFFDILAADVRNDRLPQISWIAAPEAFCEHPNFPVNYGAWYIAKVLDALTTNPEVWSKTALFLTYDENDGYFDHVVPPFPPSSDEQGRSTAEFPYEIYDGDRGMPGPYGLGQRVPMFVISPWSKGGWVCSQTFDHTSILQFMERRFGVQEPQITPWRRAICGDLTSAFDFGTSEPELPPLPDTAEYEPPDRNRHNSYSPKPPADQQLPTQEDGTRYARPLPYDLSVDASVNTSTNRLHVEFGNTGKAGAGFLVTSNVRVDGPWTYTVGSGETLADDWQVATEGYELTFYGPNGYLRSAAGKFVAGPEVTARHEAGTGNVQLQLANHGDQTVELTISNTYSDGKTTHRIQPGGEDTTVVTTERSHGWYDITVSADVDDTYLRRFAGHAETGQPSTSDPARPSSS